MNQKFCQSSEGQRITELHNKLYEMEHALDSLKRLENVPHIEEVEKYLDAEIGRYREVINKYLQSKGV